MGLRTWTTISTVTPRETDERQGAGPVRLHVSGFPSWLLFWENGEVNSARQIGMDSKQHKVPSRLIVDGQQRLTSLYAVPRGRKVLDADYKERQIEIAFCPR